MLKPISNGNNPSSVVDALISKELKDSLHLNDTNNIIKISFDMGNGTFTEIVINAHTYFDGTKGRGLENNNIFRPTSQIYVHIDELQQRFIPSLQDHVVSFAVSLKGGVDRKFTSVDLDDASFPGQKKIEKILDELETLFFNHSYFYIPY